MRRTPWTTLALAVIVAVAAGCEAFDLEPSPLVPGSQWQVVAVDGAGTEGHELILTFLAGSVTLSSRCGASTGPVTMDAQGSAITFDALAGPQGQPACPQAVLDVHVMVAHALEGTERWTSDGEAVELLGERVIRLESQATDT
jgi:hypothetical protein